MCVCVCVCGVCVCVCVCVCVIVYVYFRVVWRGNCFSVGFNWNSTVEIYRVYIYQLLRYTHTHTHIHTQCYCYYDTCQGSGVPQLEEALLAEAEVSAVRGDPDGPVEAVVIETHIDKGLG